MDWKKVLATLAPTVATALAGPLAGNAVADLAGLLGLADATPQAVQQHIEDGNLKPEDIAAIRKLELAYQDHEKERGFKYAELAAQDVASARTLAASTKSNTPTILSYCVLGGGAAMLTAILTGAAKVDSVLAGSIVGYVVAEMRQVLTFWFGSSYGSKAKDDALADVATGKGAA